MASSKDKKAKTDRLPHKVLTFIILDEDGNEVSRTAATARAFASGSCGFHATGKVTVGTKGVRYQLNQQAIAIDSKDW